MIAEATGEADRRVAEASGGAERKEAAVMDEAERRVGAALEVSFCFRWDIFGEGLLIRFQ